MARNKGQKLWKKALKLIPGGSQLASKRAEQFLPELWPAYYEKARGIEIQDLDGVKRKDFSFMGIGSCILGYADPDVNRAVMRAIEKGSMTTLNCYEEVELAELLLQMHPWAGMVRFARTGGEAMAVAVRIARAASRRDTVAICGYHGWHDWYLAANLGDASNLDGHLLPGLQPAGVPRALKGSAIPFNYNHIEELEKIVAENEIGVIVMEPMRSSYPEDNFLQNVRKIADRIGAVLIFDEITIGFRMNVGGMHQLLGVDPDIAVYGKGISNGFPMAAIIGRRAVMEHAVLSFISSTYWTERIGPVAAIATIQKMRKYNVPEHLVKIGTIIQNGWKELADRYDLRIKCSGIPPLATYSFEYGADSLTLHTFVNHEMLKRGYLSTKSVYVSWCHKKSDVRKYLENLEEVFVLVRRALDKNRVSKLLSTPVLYGGFKRLT